MNYRNCSGVDLEVAVVNIITSLEEVADKIGGSVPNKWFVVGGIKL